MYAFINNLNGDFYIGSAVNLYNRLLDYHQVWYLNDKSGTIIVKAIQKYGMENFTIVILEITTPEQAVKAEQIWIDNTQPKYNILAQRNSSLGYKHTEEGKSKISRRTKGKLRSQSVRNRISLRQIGSNNTFYGKNHTDDAKAKLRAIALARDYVPKPGFSVAVTDNFTQSTQSYESLRLARKALGISRNTLVKYNNRLYKDRYFISFVK